MPTSPARKPQQDNGPKTDVNLEQPEFVIAPFLTDKHRALLRKGMCAPLTEDQAEYFFEVVERTGLDPFQGQIWPSIRSSRDDQGVKHPNLMVVVKLQGLRTIGDRSNLCDGEDPVEWTGSDGLWKEEWLLPEPPVAARCRVYRKDRSRPQVAVCRWDAYVQLVYGRDGKEMPNAIWKRLGSHMLGKCAIAGCYRGAFPRQASGVYISEELGDPQDTNSEAAVEAEMARRYAREREYWDAERAKGHYPVGEQPQEAPPKPPVAPAAPAKIVPVQAPEPEPEPAVATDLAEDGDPRLDWRTFPISRIRLFEGRTVGNLTASEVAGLAPWMDKVSARWGQLDNDIKAHYSAINQRLEYERSRTKVTSIDDELQADLKMSFP